MDFVLLKDSSSGKTHASISRLNKQKYYSVLHFHAFQQKTTKAFANSDYVSRCYSP